MGYNWITTYCTYITTPTILKTFHISGNDLQRRLVEGIKIPDWFTFKEIADALSASSQT